jgi:hypothetical protein
MTGILILLGLACQIAGAQSTTITYQGRLMASGLPAEGPHDLRFQLFSDAVGPSGVSATLQAEDQAVSNGLFTVSLDFGPGVSTGGDLWLQVEVRPGASSGAFLGLSPRQKIASAPYAIQAGRAVAVTGPVPDGLLSGNIARLNSSPVFTGSVTANSFSGNGAGLTGISRLDSASNGPPGAVTGEPLGPGGSGRCEYQRRGGANCRRGALG